STETRQRAHRIIRRQPYGRHGIEGRDFGATGRAGEPTPVRPNRFLACRRSEQRLRRKLATPSRASARKAQANTSSTFGNDESVVQCLAIMGEIAEEQRGRNRHLDTEAGSIAGFAG